ncbi:hypothetical protein [Methylopila sp. M107]|uniref:hypothetical protein n=1 Tax=Methylopila sp. M107 TaxID=1101190 RepID=UPI0003A35AB1|nr:hypothetical protein [Methylopila sp. M107]
MTSGAALVLVAGALALSGCQTTATNQYVKYRKGPPVEVAVAECKAYAAKAVHLVIGIGSPEAVLIGAFATAAATAARRAMVFEHCMVAQGYQKPGAQAAQQPTPAPAAPPPQTPKPLKKNPARAG